MDENPNARLLALSDGVIAVAITLLILDIRLPEAFGDFTDNQLWTALVGLAPRFLAYLISFGVIGAYWVNHHSKFRHIVKHDSGLTWINLVFLLTVGLVPFTTTLIAENSGAVGTAIYAAGMVACGLTLTWLWLYAARRGLIDPEFSEEDRRRMMVSTLFSSGIFAVSVPLAFAHPGSAKYFWLLIIPVNIFVRRIARWLWQRAGHP